RCRAQRRARRVRRHLHERHSVFSVLAHLWRTLDLIRCESHASRWTRVHAPRGGNRAAPDRWDVSTRRGSGCARCAPQRAGARRGGAHAFLIRKGSSMNLQELAERLDRKVPSAYSEFVLRGGPRRLDGTAACPAAICAVNLEARAVVSPAVARDRFFIF